MLKLAVLLTLISTSAIAAQTECYFDNEFEDGTIGFFLESESITLIQRYQKFEKIKRQDNDLIIDNEVIGELKLFLPRGIIQLGDELSSFKCHTWIPRGRG